MVMVKNDRHIPQLEFELVQNAMFTLPEDQSAWLYHRWLIGSGRRSVPCLIR